MKKTLLIITSIFCASLLSITIQAQKSPPVANFYSNTDGKFKQEGKSYTVTIISESQSTSQGISVKNTAGQSVYYARSIANQPNKYVCDVRQHQSIEYLSNNRIKYFDSNKGTVTYFNRIQETPIVTYGTFKQENVNVVFTIKEQSSNIIDVIYNKVVIDSYIQDENEVNKYFSRKEKGQYIEYINTNRFKLVASNGTSSNFNQVTIYNVVGTFQPEGKTSKTTIEEKDKGIQVTNSEGQSVYYLRSSENMNKYICDARKHQSIEYLNDNRFKYYDTKKGTTMYFERFTENDSPGSIARIPPASYTFKVDGNHDNIKKVTSKDLLEDNKLRFTLSTNSQITWWKGIKVFDKHGRMVCLLSTQDSDHGPKLSQTFDASQFGRTVKVEFWKAKAFGVHTKVTTKYFKLSELQGWETNFGWVND